jgi:hypothetical protein
MEDAGFAAARSQDDLVRVARHMLAERRERDRWFDPLVFGNQGWDLLVALFVARTEGRALTPSECSVEISSPDSATARWLAFLTSEKKVSSTWDEAAPGVLRVTLTPTALDEMYTYFASVDRLRRRPGPSNFHPV